MPTTVFTEVCLLAERRRGTRAELAFPERIAELVDKYRDLPLGTVDASVIALTERLNLPAVATLDRRHFSVVLPRHVGTLALLP